MPSPARPKMSKSLRTLHFGDVEGKPVTLYSMENEAGGSVSIMDYGATIQSLIVPDKGGKPRDVVLGFDSLASYLNRDINPYFGCVVGRCANRIDGGRFTIDGASYQVSVNVREHNTTLHGGFIGFDQKIWTVTQFESKESSSILTLCYESPDGEEGFPGNLKVEVDYELDTKANRLTIRFRAASDSPTICNLTNHSYFNLEGDGTILDHELTTSAEGYLPMNNRMLPSGEIRPTAGTPFDFTKKKRIGLDIDDTADDQIVLGRGYDHSFHRPHGSEFFWRAQAPRSGITMCVFTDQVGCQLYTGNWIPKSTGKNGIPYAERSGFALETQNHPNAINMEGFDSGIVRPGEQYKHTVTFEFDHGDTQS